jgi:6,7-dimethyl-8-ribityllumazine synthase
MNLIPQNLNGQACAIGIVQARFNLPVCEGLLNACVNELTLLGVSPDNITVATVPGALEIPLVLQKMAATLEFDALIAIGAVIRGETYHFEVVSNESARAVGQVALDNDIPIANAILTTNNDEQALVRVDEKGRDAARVAVEMANLAERILPDDEFFE